MERMRSKADGLPPPLVEPFRRQWLPVGCPVPSLSWPVQVLFRPAPSQPLADTAAGFRGGGNLGRGPNPNLGRGTPKTENSTDLTHYFLGWAQIHFRKKRSKNKSFLAFGGSKRHDGPPSWALGDHGRVAPPPPPDPPVSQTRSYLVPSRPPCPAGPVLSSTAS